VVLVADEVMVKRESGLSSIWYPKGEYPDIKVDHVKESLSFYAALNVKSGKCHVLDAQRQTSFYTVWFLRNLERTYKGKKVLLVWDGAPWHRGKVKDYLKEKDKDWSLKLMYFPPYAPVFRKPFYDTEN